jgi:hypothetical protein
VRVANPSCQYCLAGLRPHHVRQFVHEECHRSPTRRVEDVAAAAGWRSLQAIRTAYMHADAQTVCSVVESRPGVPEVSSPELKDKQVQ